MERVNKHIVLAAEGDLNALEMVVEEVKDMVFNLSLRMLGSVEDGEDATQEILIKVITSLASFRYESKFTTWVYRISLNYLLDYKKSKFYKQSLDFEIFGNDIENSYAYSVENSVLSAEKTQMAQELMLSCTNVMLQCFEPKDRMIFILGTMFHIKSNIAGDMLGITPENYRKKLSRLRKRMAKFMSQYCGLVDGGLCNCSQRIEFAQTQGRLDTKHLKYRNLEQYDKKYILYIKDEMEALDTLSLIFESMPYYKGTMSGKELLERIVNTSHMKTILER